MKLLSLIIMVFVVITFSQTKILIVGRQWGGSGETQLTDWKAHLETLGDVEVTIVEHTPANISQYDQIWFADYKNWTSGGMADGTFDEPSTNTVTNILPSYLANGGNVAFLTDHDQNGSYTNGPGQTHAHISTFLQTVSGEGITITNYSDFRTSPITYTNDPRLNVEPSLAAKLGSNSYTASAYGHTTESLMGVGIPALQTEAPVPPDTSYTEKWDKYVKHTITIDSTHRIIELWDNSITYNGGDEVAYNGHKYTAKQWVNGSSEPGVSSLWIDDGVFDADAATNWITEPVDVDIWVKPGVDGAYVGIAYNQNNLLPAYQNGRVFVFTDIYNALSNNSGNNDILELIAGLTSGKEFHTTGVSVENTIFDETDGNVNIKVKLNSPAEDSTGVLSWKFVDGSASINSDITATLQGTLHFVVGSSEMLIPLTIVDDAIAEPNETFILELYDATANITLPTDPYQVTITILENDQNTHNPVIQSDTITCLEGGSIINTPNVVDPD